MRKESLNGEPKVHVYLEFLDEDIEGEEIATKLDENLAGLFTDYRDLRQMIGINPIAVTILRKGTFQKFQQRKQAAGFDLAHLKPPHMNPSDQIMVDLLNHD